VATRLGSDPRCAFEVAGDPSPYCGVRGQALATLHPERGVEMLRTLVERYLDGPDTPFARWLLNRDVEETALALEPQTLVSWDFRPRMGLDD
jgi:hypothetical protein